MNRSLFQPGDSGTSANARAAIVNRTHRVVRERAVTMQARKRRVRDLLLPCLICSAVLWIIAHAVWSVADQSLAGLEGGVHGLLLDAHSDGGSSLTVLLVWFLPISVITAAAVLLRRARAANQHGEVSR